MEVTEWAWWTDEEAMAASGKQRDGLEMVMRGTGCSGFLRGGVRSFGARLQVSPSSPAARLGRFVVLPTLLHQERLLHKGGVCSAGSASHSRALPLLLYLTGVDSRGKSNQTAASPSGTEEAAH